MVVGVGVGAVYIETVELVMFTIGTTMTVVVLPVGPAGTLDVVALLCGAIDDGVGVGGV